MRRVVVVALILAAGSLYLTRMTAQTRVDIPTFHGDRERTGWNANEVRLTPATVGSPAFGPLWNSIRFGGHWRDDVPSASVRLATFCGASVAVGWSVHRAHARRRRRGHEQRLGVCHQCVRRPCTACGHDFVADPARNSHSRVRRRHAARHSEHTSDRPLRRPTSVMLEAWCLSAPIESRRSACARILRRPCRLPAP